MQLWISRFIWSQGGSSAEGANTVKFNWIPSVEATFWSGFCKVQAMPHHTPGEIMQRNVRITREGYWHLDIARISTPLEVRFFLRMTRSNRFLSSHRFRVQLIHCTGRRLSVRTITWRLLTVGYHSRRPARCPRLTLVHRRRHCQWTRGHRVLDIRHSRHSIFTDESRFKLHYTDGRARCEGGRVRVTLMSVCRERMAMLVNLSSSYGLDFIMVPKVSWLW